MTQPPPHGSTIPALPLRPVLRLGRPAWMPPQNPPPLFGVAQFTDHPEDGEWRRYPVAAAALAGLHDFTRHATPADDGPHRIYVRARWIDGELHLIPQERDAELRGDAASTRAAAVDTHRWSDDLHHPLRQAARWWSEAHRYAAALRGLHRDLDTRFPPTDLLAGARRP